MQKFESIKDGLEALQNLVAGNRRKVGALLTFQDSGDKLCPTCFLFESVEDETA